MWLGNNNSNEPVPILSCRNVVTLEAVYIICDGIMCCVGRLAGHKGSRILSVCEMLASLEKNTASEAGNDVITPLTHQWTGHTGHTAWTGHQRIIDKLAATLMVNESWNEMHLGAINVYSIVAAASRYNHPKSAKLRVLLFTPFVHKSFWW